MHILKLAPPTAILSLALLVVGSGGLHISRIDLVASSHRYDLLGWEVSNLPDKWIHKLEALLPWNSQTHQQELKQLNEFFHLGAKLRSLEQQLSDLGRVSSKLDSIPVKPSTTDHNIETKHLAWTLNNLRHKWSKMKPSAEETLESELAVVLSREGFSSPFGLLPPIDVALSAPPLVLVVSPRDKIDRNKILLLKQDMAVETMEELEAQIFRELNMAALVTNIGGVSTFPTTIHRDSSLQQATYLAAHEWLHHYLFFHPLGWQPWDWTPEMNTLNETAATIAGEEIGEMVYAAITGGEVKTLFSTNHSPVSNNNSPVDPPPFKFNEEMRSTRLRVNEFLSEGKVGQAETYMEERRVVFADNGIHIRKLNQAYFAFHGTYGTNPASVSPIGDQVKELRNMASSVGDFISAIGHFSSYQEFTEYISSTNRAESPGPIPDGQAN